MDPRRPFAGRDPRQADNQRLFSSPQAPPPSSNLRDPFLGPGEARGSNGSKQPSPSMGAPSLKSIHSVRRLEKRSSVGSMGSVASLSAKYALSHSPATWGTPLLVSDYPEADDELHNPDSRNKRSTFSARGLTNVGCLLVLSFGLLALFVGYPMISTFTKRTQTTQGGFNLGGINATGQVPVLPGNHGLIDKDTPESAFTKRSYLNEEEFVLVFSDEFEQDGRTFWAGDDPYWEAVDLHYWGTNDLEWYDPAQVTTQDGALQIRVDRVDDPSINHNMTYRGGMLQSWNKFCFTGGLIEVSVRLPGSPTVSGFWPGVWTMGNLGRAGYGATNEGLWPFSYDSCDVGTLPNQTYPGTETPLAARQGDGQYGGALSYLPGQRLSACTCPGESHPGPVRANGDYVGRAAPEIDILEALVEEGEGRVSLSAQFAPFNAGYRTPNDTSAMVFYDPTKTVQNSYRGGAWQQCTSGLSVTNQSCYELSGGCFTTFGFEYKPGFDEGYITWYNNNERAWTLYAAAMVGDQATEIDVRPIPLEPMYIIMNLAISEGFGEIDVENLVFPATMSIDYVRVYQPKNAVNTGCDPQDFPTAQYIDTYKTAYTNYNLTTWDQFGEPWPKNRLAPGGCT